MLYTIQVLTHVMQAVCFVYRMLVMYSLNCLQQRQRGVLQGTDVRQHSARLVDLQAVVNRSAAKMKLLAVESLKRREQGMLCFVAFYKTLEVVEYVYKKIGLPYRVISGSMTTDERVAAKRWVIVTGKQIGRAHV